MRIVGQCRNKLTVIFKVLAGSNNVPAKTVGYTCHFGGTIFSWTVTVYKTRQSVHVEGTGGEGAGGDRRFGVRTGLGGDFGEGGLSAVVFPHLIRQRGEGEGEVVDGSGFEVNVALHLIRGSVPVGGEADGNLVVFLYTLGYQGQIADVALAAGQCGLVAPHHLYTVGAGTEGVGAVDGTEGEVTAECVARGERYLDALQRFAFHLRTGGVHRHLCQGEEVVHLELIAVGGGGFEGSVLPVVSEQTCREAECLFGTYRSAECRRVLAVVVRAVGIIGVKGRFSIGHISGERCFRSLIGSSRETGIFGRRAEDTEAVIGCPKYTGDVAAVRLGVDAGAAFHPGIVDGRGECGVSFLSPSVQDIVAATAEGGKAHGSDEGGQFHIKFVNHK